MSTEAGQIVDQMVPSAPTQMSPVDEQSSGGSTEATPVSDKGMDKVSGRLEVLIRREQAAVAREQAAKAKEAEIQAHLSRIKEFESVKENPKRALELLGLDYDQLTQSLLNDGNLPPEVQIKKVEDKFEAFKREQELEKERLQKEADKKAEEQLTKTIENFKSEINSYISDNKSRYEFIEFEGQQELVFEVVDEHYKRTTDPETGVGKVLSIAEAADKVEAYLEKKYEKAKALEKTKTLWGSIPRETQKTLEQQALKPQMSQPPKTLSNQLSASSTKPKVGPISDDERIQKAIAYARSLRPNL